MSGGTEVQEQGEVREVSEETRRVDQATAEPEAVVEQERSVDESEAIEAAVVEAVEAAETAADEAAETEVRSAQEQGGGAAGETEDRGRETEQRKEDEGEVQAVEVLDTAELDTKIVPGEELERKRPGKEPAESTAPDYKIKTPEEEGDTPDIKWFQEDPDAELDSKVDPGDELEGERPGKEPAESAAPDYKIKTPGGEGDTPDIKWFQEDPDAELDSKVAPGEELERKRPGKEPAESAAPDYKIKTPGEEGDTPDIKWFQEDPGAELDSKGSGKELREGADPNQKVNDETPDFKFFREDPDATQELEPAPVKKWERVNFLEDFSAVEAVLGRVVMEEDFQAAVVEDPQAALEEYELSHGDREMLQKLPPEQLNAVIEEARSMFQEQSAAEKVEPVGQLLATLLIGKKMWP